ncbi:MAG: MaoC family dehydratase [bacterium]
MSKETVLRQLQEAVAKGEEHVGDWLTVDQARIDRFADATEDHQWIHVDPKRAQAESPYKDTIAHGYLTLSLLPGLTGAVKGGVSQYAGVKLGVNYGLNRVRFPAPVLVNSRVRSRRKIKEVSEVPGGLQLVSEVTIEVEGGEKPCCVAETVSRMYF